MPFTFSELVGSRPTATSVQYCGHPPKSLGGGAGPALRAGTLAGSATPAGGGRSRVIDTVPAAAGTGANGTVTCHSPVCEAAQKRVPSSGSRAMRA